jgi:diadenosine tetraphosphate (Ap4A) HIT family hydrolase
MDQCIACDLAHGRRPLPGGLIHKAGGWLVEHCVGPLGLGTLIVKPQRHVTAVAELAEDEASDLGLLLWRTSHVASKLVEADQVYNCLWSHAGGSPVHIHYVIQPVTRQQMAEFGSHGPNLQVAMFSAGNAPDAEQVESIAERARQLFAEVDLPRSQPAAPSTRDGTAPSRT